MLTVWCLRLYASPRPRSSLRSLRLSMHREAPGLVHVQPSGRRVDYPHCSELQPTLLSEYPVCLVLPCGRGGEAGGGEEMLSRLTWKFALKVGFAGLGSGQVFSVPILVSYAAQPNSSHTP